MLPVTDDDAKIALKKMFAIHRQLIRFHRMSLEERMVYFRRYPEEMFLRIPNIDGTAYLQYGAIGQEKFHELVNLLLQKSSIFSERLSRGKIFDTLVNSFVKRVLEEQLDLNKKTVSLVLEDALAELADSLVVTEHYLPCDFFTAGGPDEFNVGPVTFTRRLKFFRDKRKALMASVITETASHVESVQVAVANGYSRESLLDEAGSNRLVRKLQARAIGTYRKHPWVASVKVVDTDADTSHKLAVSAVETALNVIRVLFGSAPTQNIKLAWARGSTLRTAQLYTDGDGTIRSSLEITFSGLGNDNNWHSALYKFRRDLDVLGSSIESIVEAGKIRHLRDRMLDAINWFGDAATDSNTSSSIVKYVSAMERLFFGSFSSDMTKTFVNRVAGVLQAFGCDEGGQTREKVFALYQARSKVVHGAPFRIRYEALQMAHDAESMCRWCLLCAAQLYPMIARAIEDPMPADLELVMLRITDEGLNWLRDEAGTRR